MRLANSHTSLRMPTLLAGIAAALIAASAPSSAEDSLPSIPGISLHGAIDEPKEAPASPPPAAPDVSKGNGGPAKAATAKPVTAAKKPVTKTAKPAGDPAAKTQPGKQPAGPAETRTATAKDAPKTKGGSQSIAVLVNDEPITGYEIEQRAAFLALSSGGGGGDMKAKAEARWQAIIKDPKTNDRFKQLLRDKGVKSQEEARKLQTQFVKDLQRNMIEGLRREARSSALAGSRTKAQDELIDEKLKLQEAKKLSAMSSEEDVDKMIGGIAERNKMNLTQFGQHMKQLGVDISTMRARFMAEASWREVIRRRFGRDILVNDRDVDRLVASNAGGEDDVELQLQRIAIFTPPNADQKTVAQKLSEAQAAATRFTDCKSTKDLAAQIPGARFDDVGMRRPSAIPEPMRSMLLNARDGDILPPAVGEGSIELWTVCGRKVVTANEQKREEAQAELRQKEFEILAKKHLKDLRQDAAIEYR